jgi:hypothetical protein
MEPRRAPVHDLGPRARHRPLAQVGIPRRRHDGKPSTIPALAAVTPAGAMSKSDPARLPVTVARLPAGRCQVCQRAIPSRTGQASTAMTEHYRQEHPTSLPRRPNGRSEQTARCPLWRKPSGTALDAAIALLGLGQDGALARHRWQVTQRGRNRPAGPPAEIGSHHVPGAGSIPRARLR